MKIWGKDRLLVSVRVSERKLRLRFLALLNEPWVDRVSNCSNFYFSNFDFSEIENFRSVGSTFEQLLPLHCVQPALRASTVARPVVRGGHALSGAWPAPLGKGKKFEKNFLKNLFFKVLFRCFGDELLQNILAEKEEEERKRRMKRSEEEEDENAEDEWDDEEDTSVSASISAARSLRNLMEHFVDQVSQCQQSCCTHIKTFSCCG